MPSSWIRRIGESLVTAGFSLLIFGLCAIFWSIFAPDLSQDDRTALACLCWVLWAIGTVVSLAE